MAYSTHVNHAKNSPILPTKACFLHVSYKDFTSYGKEYTAKKNADWYYAKGKGDATSEERQMHANMLVRRVFHAASHETTRDLFALLEAHPSAVLVPIRGIESPNKAINIIPATFALALEVTHKNEVNTTVFKTTTTGNTGATAKNRLYTVHHFEGNIEAGKDYFIVDDVSTTGATAYYAARHIASQGGQIVGILQMGLTPRGKAAPFKPKEFVGDEATLQMSEKTKKTLLKKADEATLNAVLQYHGIAYHWQTLTDALGRALATDWKNASDLAGIPSGGRSAAAKPTVTRDSQNDTSARQSLPAFPGEKAAAGLEPGSKPTPAPRIESNGQMGFSFSLSRDPSNPPNPSDSFSLSRATPAELSQSLIDKIGEDALRLEQPKISYEDKNQLLLDFSASVIADADGRAASTNAGDIQEERLLLGRRSGLGEISILAQKHLQEIKENLKVDFIGATIDSAKALAIHAQSLRNPKYETFYLLAAQLRNKRHKGGAGFKIVDVMAVTSRVPCSAKVFTDGKDADAGYQSHIDFLRGAKATHYFMLHNHPSGDVSPSSMDLRLTIQHAQRLANVGIQLVDHIVINHKNYATIDAYGVENQYSIPASALKDAIDPYAWPSPALAPGIGMMTNGPLAVINVARSIQSAKENPDMILGLLTNARLNVVAQLLAPASEFKKLTPAIMADYARNHAGARLFLHGQAKTNQEALAMIGDLRVLNDKQIVEDMIISTPENPNGYISARDKNLYNNVRLFFGLEDADGVRVQETLKSFSLSRDPSNPPNPPNPSDSRYLELAQDPEANRDALQSPGSVLAW